MKPNSKFILVYCPFCESELQTKIPMQVADTTEILNKVYTVHCEKCNMHHAIHLLLPRNGIRSKITTDKLRQFQTTHTEDVSINQSLNSTCRHCGVKCKPNERRIIHAENCIIALRKAKAKAAYLLKKQKQQELKREEAKLKSIEQDN